MPRGGRSGEGSYTPDTRDDAESAQNSILKAPSTGPARKAYLVVKSLAEARIPRVPPTRFRQLAHSKAERDAEFAPWQPDQIISMEMHHAEPICGARRAGVASWSSHTMAKEPGAPRKTNASVSSAALIERLQNLADTLKSNATGPIHGCRH
jgi:hypothetical protein